MGSSLKYDHKSPHLSHARCEMKSFWWKCQVNNVSEGYKKRSEEGTSRRNGRKLSSDLMDQHSLGEGGWCRQGRRWDSPGSGSWCPAWKSGKLSLSWSERLGPQSALPTQKIASSTLSVKLQRPPFMDLEISLHVSAFACQAQLFPRGKRQTGGPLFSSPWTHSSQCARAHSWNPSLLWTLLGICIQ